jgi:hypothetical protein
MTAWCTAHWEYDLRTALQIAEAEEPIKPLWLEDPLQVQYSEEWAKLCEGAHVVSLFRSLAFRTSARPVGATPRSVSVIRSPQRSAMILIRSHFLWVPYAHGLALDPNH